MKARKTTMRPQDRRHFENAAFHFRVWILVRDTNEASLAYIDQALLGKPYFPKTIDCKPKTADVDPPGRRHKGLVVDPDVSAGSFTRDKLNKTLEEWEKWPWQKYLDAADKGRPKAVQAKTISGAPAETFYYKVDMDRSSPHYGCLMRGEDAGKMCYLFGDYDLKDIVAAEHPAGNLAAVEMLHGQLSMRGPRLYAIQDYINGRIGVPVLQHGGDAQARPHAAEVIHVFSPGGKYSKLESERRQRWFYEGLSPFGVKFSDCTLLDWLQQLLGLNVFQGRQTLSAKSVKEALERHDQWVKDFAGDPPSTYRPWTPEVIRGGKE
jgi:hypothetical protein